MKRIAPKAAALYTVTLIILSAIILLSCDDDSPTVRIKSGMLRGVDSGDSMVFRGIPYAAPPVDALRWRAPRDPQPWTGVRAADEFGSICPQTEGDFGAGSLSEDCLYLNVTAPKGRSPRGPYPVMVWIHGGAFISGSGSDAGYDPTRLVQEGVIVVTLNYRLGALGFLPHPALTDEAGESGNYGLMDQQKALKWVQENIHAFGGDPKNVTIFGESAGGHSVLSHLAAPSSRGLFGKAIAQSGAYSPNQLPLFLGYGAYGIPFLTRAGCTTTDNAETLAFMRNMTVEEVLAAQGDDWYVPVTGGSFLPNSINDAFETGQFNKVPVLSGCNLNEGRLFVALDIANGIMYNTEAEYMAGATSLMETAPRKLNIDLITADYLSMQNPANENRFRLALSKIWTDYFFNANNYLQWNQLARSTNTFAYWFADVEAPNTFDSPYLEMDAAHSLEIPYVFGTVGAAGGTQAQIALSEEMVRYWTGFAKTGSPDAAWRPFVSGDLSSYVKKLDTPSKEATAKDFATKHFCDYWNDPPVIAVN